MTFPFAKRHIFTKLCPILNDCGVPMLRFGLSETLPNPFACARVNLVLSAIDHGTPFRTWEVGKRIGLGLRFSSNWNFAHDWTLLHQFRPLLRSKRLLRLLVNVVRSVFHDICSDRATLECNAEVGVRVCLHLLMTDRLLTTVIHRPMPQYLVNICGTEWFWCTKKHSTRPG